ncbi:DNRLRE domain-containing protein [Candidatus Bipolaricaulota bacterium]|nr:DNRLRE domain-containing protein [Candidatus Bipolaricaulota bacterium]
MILRLTTKRFSLFKYLLCTLLLSSLLVSTVWAEDGLPSGQAKLLDWDESQKGFSFEHRGPAESKMDFFIADRGEESVIHAFDAPGVIDMGTKPLDQIDKAPKEGYKDTVRPRQAHSYVIRSKGKYAKIYLQEIFSASDYKNREVTEYEFDWVIQPDGTRTFGKDGSSAQSSVELKKSLGKVLEATAAQFDWQGSIATMPWNEFEQVFWTGMVEDNYIALGIIIHDDEEEAAEDLDGITGSPGPSSTKFQGLPAAVTKTGREASRLYWRMGRFVIYVTDSVSEKHLYKTANTLYSNAKSSLISSGSDGTKTPPEGKADQVILKDRFEGDGLSGWKTVNGNWRVQNGRLVQLSNYSEGWPTGGTYAYTGSSNWRNYSLSARVMSEDDDKIGFVFRYLNPDNYYIFSWQKDWGSRMRFTKIVDGEGTELARNDLGYQQGKWYDLKVKVAGDKMIAYLDGKEVLSATDDSLTRGQAGLYCHGNQGSYFDDFLVKSIEVSESKKRGLLPSADGMVYAYSYRNWNRANRGNWELMRASWNPVGGESRVYLKFNTSELPASGRVILKLYQNNVRHEARAPLGVYRVTSTWKEGDGTYVSGERLPPADRGELSWEQQPTFTDEPVTTFRAPEEGWVEVDITPLVRQWQSGAPNHGLMIRPAGPNPSRKNAHVFRTKETQKTEERPRLSPISTGPGKDKVQIKEGKFQLESGKISLNHEWKQVNFDQPFNYPVVVAKPISYTGRDPATVAIKDVTSTGFKVRIQEWPYLNDEHTTETLSYLAVERGHFTLAGGLEVEADVIATDITGVKTAIIQDRAQRVNFFSPFPTKPIVLAARNSFHGADTVATRVSKVTPQGFVPFMQEQEVNQQEHSYETIAYVALKADSAKLGGEILITGRTEASHESTTVTLPSGEKIKIHLNEEKSANEETDHNVESVGYLTFSESPSLFIADIQSTEGLDPVNLRYEKVSRDKRETHTVIIDGSANPDRRTYYRIEVTGSIEPVDGNLEGYEVGFNPETDSISGNVATGRVGCCQDGFRVTGEIRSITLDEPEAAVVLINGQKTGTKNRV